MFCSSGLWFLIIICSEYMYVYIYIYIYTNLPVSDIVRLSHPQSGDSQGQETFLAPSSDKQTRDCDTECSNHNLSQSTLRSKGFSRSKMNWWAIYTNLPVSDIVRLPHPRSGDSQGQEMFLAPSADKQTCNYDTAYSNHHPFQSTLRSKIGGCKWFTTHRVLKSHRSKIGVIYAIMKTMCPPSYGFHHNGFVATHALRHIM